MRFFCEWCEMCTFLNGADHIVSQECWLTCHGGGVESGVDSIQNLSPLLTSYAVERKSYN